MADKIHQVERSPWITRTIWVLCLALAVLVNVMALRHHGEEGKYSKRTPVHLWHMWTGDYEKDLQRYVDSFNKSQNEIEIIPLSVPESVTQSKFLLATASGDPPDMMWHWMPTVPKWADDGVIQPIDAIMTPDEWKKYKRSMFPIAEKMAMYKGRLYAVIPYCDVRGLFYRVDDLQEAGLDPNHLPQTLEELDKWATKLNRFDKKGNLTRIGFMPTAGLTVSWAMFAPSFGGGFYDWKSNKVTVDTPGNLKALEYLVNERKELGLQNATRFETGATQAASGANWPFATGAYSIVVDGMWRVRFIEKYMPDLKYVTGPIPPPAGGKKNGGWVVGSTIVIPRGAKHPKEAWQFLKFITGFENPEAPSEMVKDGILPLFPDVIKSRTFQKYVDSHPQFKTFADVLPSENLEPTPPVPYQNYLTDRMGEITDRAKLGIITPRQAVDALQKLVYEQEAKYKEFHPSE